MPSRSPHMATLPPIELQAPDIRPFAAGNTGVPYVHRFDSGRPGPVVMVQALTHGNELCGAIALQWLFSQPLAPLRTAAWCWPLPTWRPSSASTRPRRTRRAASMKT
jgi:hypothetical protein